MLDKLKNSLKKFARLGLADKNAVEDLCRDIQRVLIQSDVNVKLVFELTKKIKERALDEKLPPGITRREHVVNIVYEELVNFLGKRSPEINLKKHKILLVGLFGSGKTTTAAKLAKFYQKKGLTVGLICTDTWRPAAYDQLSQLSKKIDAEFYGNRKEKDTVKILKEGLDKLKKKDIIIVDSAGRSALDKELSKELVSINKVLKPEEKILVLSGDIGQAAQKQAEEFDKLIDLTGIVLTKMDSSAKGGGALSACFAAKVNVTFIGIGEKIEDLQVYDPVRFVSRLLGMGDLQTLLEKAQKAISPEKAQKILTGEFTLNEFLEQIESTKKMGSLDQIVDMLPFGGKLKIPKNMLDVQEEKMRKWKFIIDSMTKKERLKPDIIDKSRVERIAKGSGTKPEEVRELLRHYKQIKKITKKLKSGKALKRGGLGKLMKQFGI